MNKYIYTYTSPPLLLCLYCCLSPIQWQRQVPSRCISLTRTQTCLSHTHMCVYACEHSLLLCISAQPPVVFLLSRPVVSLSRAHKHRHTYRHTYRHTHETTGGPLLLSLSHTHTHTPGLQISPLLFSLSLSLSLSLSFHTHTHTHKHVR